MAKVAALGVASVQGYPSIGSALAALDTVANAG